MGKPAFKPISEKAFNKMVKNYGYFIEKTANDYKIVDADGNFIMPFAIFHVKGQKRQVLPVYVMKFYNYVQNK